MAENLIAPSILSADFAKLGQEVDNVLAAGADIVHFDVMDNHYVPNLTIGPLVCEALRKHGVTAPIDVHLMVKPVDRIIPDFAKAGATYITFHPEASEHVDRSLQLIRNEGCKSGLVFNPATPLSYLEHVLDKVDMVLLMSVNPGFGGQSFIPGTLDKLRQARKMIDASGRDIRLEIDGGVKVDNIREIRGGRGRHLRCRLGHLRRRQGGGPQQLRQRDRAPCAPNWPEPAESGGVPPMSLRKPEMILIDVDGTLVDSVPDLAYCVDQMLLALGREPYGETEVRDWVGNGVERLVRRALIGQLDGEPDEADFERAYPIFLDLYAENTSKRSLLYPGIKRGPGIPKGAGLQAGLRDQQGGAVHRAAAAGSGGVRRFRDRGQRRYSAEEEAGSAAAAACRRIFRRGSATGPDGGRLDQRREGGPGRWLPDRVHELRLQSWGRHPQRRAGRGDRSPDRDPAPARSRGLSRRRVLPYRCRNGNKTRPCCSKPSRDPADGARWQG